MDIFCNLKWKNSLEKKIFEDKLQKFRQSRKEWSIVQTFSWLFLIFIIPYVIQIGLHWTLAYYMVKHAVKDVNHNTESLFVITYYPILTLICQTIAFVCVALYHFIDYRNWNFFSLFMIFLCLPFNVYILHKEPLGPVFTVLGLVATYLPLTITMADAMYPKEETYINTKCNLF